MRIPPFWARASRRDAWSEQPIEAPGWSFTSLEDAARVAEERLTLLISVLKGEADDEGRYLYGDRPVREPIIETIDASVMITRNAYGALCLNTEDIVFLDVDLKPPSFTQRLFGASNEDAAHERIQKTMRVHPEWSARIYRTSAGFRLLFTHARIAAKDAAPLFDAFDTDRMYQKLCLTQQSFRARLTAKPWRIGLPRMRAVFPWRNASVEQDAARWAAAYDLARADFCVCRLMDQIGAPTADPLIKRVVAIHDSHVLDATNERSLA